eukprot:UN09292
MNGAAPQGLHKDNPLYENNAELYSFSYLYKILTKQWEP